MTAAQILEDLKLVKLAGLYHGLGDTILLAHLNAAKRYFEDNTELTFKGSAPLANAAAARTFDLSSGAVIQLTTNAKALMLGKVWPSRYPDMEKVNLAVIQQLHDLSSYNGIPRLYALTQVADALTLDVWPACQSAGTFAAPFIYCNTTERLPDVSSTQASLWPSYADDGIIYRAALTILISVNEKGGRLQTIGMMFKDELAKVDNMAIKFSSGHVRAGIAQ